MGVFIKVLGAMHRRHHATDKRKKGKMAIEMKLFSKTSCLQHIDHIEQDRVRSRWLVLKNTSEKVKVPLETVPNMFNKNTG